MLEIGGWCWCWGVCLVTCTVGGNIKYQQRINREIIVMKMAHKRKQLFIKINTDEWNLSPDSTYSHTKQTELTLMEMLKQPFEDERNWTKLKDGNMNRCEWIWLNDEPRGSIEECMCDIQRFVHLPPVSLYPLVVWLRLHLRWGNSLQGGIFLLLLLMVSTPAMTVLHEVIIDVHSKAHQIVIQQPESSGQKPELDSLSSRPHHQLCLEES